MREKVRIAAGSVTRTSISPAEVQALGLSRRRVASRLTSSSSGVMLAKRGNSVAVPYIPDVDGRDPDGYLRSV